MNALNDSVSCFSRPSTVYIRLNSPKLAYPPETKIHSKFHIIKTTKHNVNTFPIDETHF